MFQLITSPINTNELKASYQNNHDGAFVCFEGIVRADSHQSTHVSFLTYHANNDQCYHEGSLIVNEAVNKFELSHAICVQRIGAIHVAEPAIWIGAWSTHRDHAFQGCRYIIEEVKKRLHIWKKESHEDGTSKWIHGKTQ